MMNEKIPTATPKGKIKLQRSSLTKVKVITTPIDVISKNIDFILPITIIFLLITSIGVVITLTLVNEDRWSLILPLGVAVGIFSFIIFLGTLSYFFKARPGILVILIIYILFGI